MRTGWIAALIIIVLGLGSCSTSATSNAASATSKPYTGPPIGSILLTAGDLPVGWSAITTRSGGSFLPRSCGTDTPLETVDPSAYAAVTFSPSSNTALELLEEIAFSDTAKSSLTNLEGILNACRTFESYGSTGTLTPVTFPRYADQQAGFDVSPSLRTRLPVRGRGTWLHRRSEERLSRISRLLPSTDPFDWHQLEPLVPVALARVPSS